MHFYLLEDLNAMSEILSMFILVLILRHSITKLRQIGLATNLILDKHIYFHKVTGRLIMFYSLLHTATHLGNYCKIFYWIIAMLYNFVP